MSGFFNYILELEGLAPTIFGVVVFLTALWRFQQPPAPPPPPSTLPPGPARWWDTTKKLTQRGDRGLIQYSPPTRAYTTFISFWMYRLLYSLSAVGVFVLVYKVPRLSETIVELMKQNSVMGLNLAELGPLALAVLVAGIVPVPFRGIEERVRRFFHEHAMIDARRRRETARLQQAKFQGEDLSADGRRLPGEAMRQVWRELESEDFSRDDLVFDPDSPTARSMWMKASLLRVHINAWQARHKYMRSFADVKEPDGVTRTVTIVETNYQRLKDRARACFNNENGGTDQAESQVCAEFRQDCQVLLESMYDLLARLSPRAPQRSRAH